MSDPTVAHPRSSSAAAPGLGDGNRSDSSNPDVEHAPNTALPQSGSRGTNEEISSGPEARVPVKQKRKRTSPKDQAILEAEYNQNPKPNKAARAVIMEKVDLNEKELQIWFQNRRQINRRKSRPLLPHELAAFGLGGMAALSSDPASSIASNSRETLEDAASRSQVREAIAPQTQTIGTSAHSIQQGAVHSPESSQSSLLQSTPMPSSSQEKSGTEPSSLPSSESVIKSFLSTPGYLANRWNPANSFTPASSQSALLATPPIPFNSTLPSSCPGRIELPNSATPSSRVRLSMSLDGKAELVATDLSPHREYAARPSSSGPALPQYRIRGLQRSHSSLPFGPLPRLSSANGTLLPRLPRGRSRDSRNWEFFCDSEARDELTTQAENESNGSAVAAISLLRSASNSVLKSSANKRNAPPSRQEVGGHEKRPKLGRAMSSLARLQTTGKTSSKMPRSNHGKPGLMGSPSGDSDKENWIPEDDNGVTRRRPLPSSRPDFQSQVVLGDNSNIPTHAVNFGGGKSRRRKAAQDEPQIFEDQENGEASQEVEKFMRGEISPSKKGDLDCIQGLLSLSQGNWR